MKVTIRLLQYGRPIKDLEADCDETEDEPHLIRVEIGKTIQTIVRDQLCNLSNQYEY